MSLIKCPECGHEVSDKAPACPHCGAPIATMISNRHDGVQPLQKANGGVDISAKKPKKNSSVGRKFVMLIVLLAVAVGAYYLYSMKGDKTKEQNAFEQAMVSHDVDELQLYLDTYTNAPQQHRDSIQNHVSAIRMEQQEWTNALVSGSKTALESYIARHPETPHKQEAQHKIDSLDWAFATGLNTLEAYNNYLDEHPNGEHYDDAHDGIKALNAKTVQPEEKQMIASLFRTFFNSITARDDEALTSTVASLLTTFLGKSDATKADVSTFLRKIYKEDIANMDWNLPTDYKITKKEIGDGKYEYSVNLTVGQTERKIDGSDLQNKYRIAAKVNPDGKITEFNMTRIIE